MRVTVRGRLAALVVAGVVAVGVAAGAEAEVVPGQVWPELTGRNLVGETVAIDVPAGSLGIVAFWSIYCKPCVAEISSLIRLQERYGGRVKVYGINTDGELPPARVRAFVERYEKFEKRKINYPLIMDEHNAITKQLGIGFLPAVIAIDAQRRVVGNYAGFDEKDEEEIFAGLEKFIPSQGEAAKEEEWRTFEVQLQVPVCGFYDETGWLADFDGLSDRNAQQDKMAETARDLAVKTALDRALEGLGITLLEVATGDCIKPYGVRLHNAPWKERDPLTNLLNSLNYRKYSEVTETTERWVGADYLIRQKVAIKMADLKEDLERLKVSLKPLTINFVSLNMGLMQRRIFETGVLSQSKFIGRTDFPAYTVYTDQETFIGELEKMDFGGIKVFIDEAGEGVVELEVWR
jgi:thiol-disulfide isomerase/thioredoxin